MNISASNQSLENIIIRQVKEKKRPSFASVFEKINKCKPERVFIFNCGKVDIEILDSKGLLSGILDA
jgi:hypothetical protein